jgi:hypothetical protein
MKKVLLSLAIVALVGIAFTSCKKSCTCKTTILGTTTSSEIDSIDSEDACNTLNTAFSITGGSCTWE